MKSHDNSLHVLINIHERLTRDFPMTPYNCWCRKVHKMQASPQQKLEYILSWELNPHEYTNPTLFSADWQLFQLLRKSSTSEDVGETERQVAFAKFLSAEDRCKQVNEFYSSALPKGVARLSHGVINIVSRTLGPIEDFFKWVESYDRSDSLLRRYPEFGLAFVDAEVKAKTEAIEFGPGSSVGTSGSLKTPGEKLILGTCTPSCAYIAKWLASIWHIPAPRLVEGSVLTFVNKTIGEARTICFEPSVNMLIQKLFGLYLRNKMKVLWGIDLRDQGRNANLAQLGSLCDSYATEDETSASDLFSSVYVCHHTPPAWFAFLDDIRSKSYLCPETGKQVTFHKFSTMGNGFTFELESMFFFAIVKSAIDEFGDGESQHISVFGDDLIFPKRYAPLIEQALSVSGHIPNRKKSFSTGPFRESCGGDYFNGWNVTPIKIKRFQCEKPEHVIHVHNMLVAVSFGSTNRQCVPHWFTRAINYIASWLRERYPKLGDGPQEYTIHRTRNCHVATPSNRWLWEHGESESRNNVWAQAIQSRVPKWVLLPEVQPDLGYEVLPIVAKYLCSKGYAARVSEESPTYAFKRNPVLQKQTRRKGNLPRPTN